jgi:hypothetical protein
VAELTDNLAKKEHELSVLGDQVRETTQELENLKKTNEVFKKKYVEVNAEKNKNIETMVGLRREVDSLNAACDSLARDLASKRLELEKKSEVSRELAQLSEESAFDFEHVRKAYTFEEQSEIFSTQMIRQKREIDELKEKIRQMNREMREKKDVDGDHRRENAKEATKVGFYSVPGLKPKEIRTGMEKTIDTSTFVFQPKTPIMLVQKKLSDTRLGISCAQPVAGNRVIGREGQK